MTERIIVSATIPNGASVSGAVDCNKRAIVGFVAPAAWTTAALTIEASVDGTNWITSIFDSTGTAAGSFSAITASAGYAVDLVSLVPWQSIRIRSGTSASPVNQGADRVFKVVQRLLA